MQGGSGNNNGGGGGWFSSYFRKAERSGNGKEELGEDGAGGGVGVRSYGGAGGGVLSGPNDSTDSMDVYNSLPDSSPANSGVFLTPPTLRVNKSGSASVSHGSGSGGGGGGSSGASSGGSGSSDTAMLSPTSLIYGGQSVTAREARDMQRAIAESKREANTPVHVHERDAGPGTNSNTTDTPSVMMRRALSGNDAGSDGSGSVASGRHHHRRTDSSASGASTPMTPAAGAATMMTGSGSVVQENGGGAGDERDPRYNVEGMTHFNVALPDGFFALHGNFPELRGETPTLDALAKLGSRPPQDSASPRRGGGGNGAAGEDEASSGRYREVVVVDHRADEGIVELEQEAAIAVCGAEETPQARIQVLARIVSKRMGGTCVNDEALQRRWEQDVDGLTSSPIRMLGNVRYGLCRHRALLFKVLSDSLSMADDSWQCRLLCMFPGAWVPEVRIGRYFYLVDLMSAPGTLLPSFNDDVQDQDGTDVNTDIDVVEAAAAAAVDDDDAPTAPPLAAPDVLEQRQHGEGQGRDEGWDASTGRDADAGEGEGATPMVEERDLIDLSEGNGDADDERWEHAIVRDGRTEEGSGGGGGGDVDNTSGGVPEAEYGEQQKDGEAPINATAQEIAVSLTKNKLTDDDKDDNAAQETEEEPVAMIRPWIPPEPERAAPDVHDGETQTSLDPELCAECTGADISLHEDDPFHIRLNELEYEESSRLGVGSFGEVFKGRWRGTAVAIKRLLASHSNNCDECQTLFRDFLGEVDILKKLRHPNVVLFMGVVHEPSQRFSAIVTEYLHRGSLFKLLHSGCGKKNLITQVRMMQMAVDIAMGMQYLHTCTPMIVHRDLKSPNLLVDKNFTVKVADFGLSRTKRANATFLSRQSRNGTLEWMAPEVLRNEQSNEKEDLYSFGVILWELITGSVPWSELLNPVQVVYAVGVQGRRLAIPEDTCPPSLHSLIEACWDGDPERRPSFEEVLDILRPELQDMQRKAIESARKQREESGAVTAAAAAAAAATTTAAATAAAATMATSVSPATEPAAAPAAAAV